MQQRIPSALVVGVSASVASAATFTVADLAMTRSDASFDVLLRWSAFSSGLALVAVLLTAAAVLGLAHRLAGWPRTVVQVAAALYLVYLGWMLGRSFAFELVGEDKAEWLQRYGWRMFSVIAWIAPVLLTFAARAWWRPSSPWVTVAAVVMVVLEAASWAPYVQDWLQDAEGRSTVGRLFWPLREVVTSGALLVLVHGILRDAPRALPAPDQAAAWLRRASGALLIRIIAAVALAVLGVGIVKSPGAIKLVLIVGPVITVLAVLGFAWSLLAVVDTHLPGMPQLRLVLAAGCVALGAGLQLDQLVAAFRMLSDRGGFGDTQVGQWSVFAPLISIAGIVLACSAVASWAAKVGNEELREASVARAVIHAVLSVLVLLLPLALAKATSTGAVLGLVLLGAVLAVLAVAVVVPVFRRAGESIAPSPTLPEARLR